MLLVLMIAVVAFIVFVERSERRIPVQYAKRVVGRKVMGGQSTHLPLRVNAGGVMPVIFASSILALPQMLGALFNNNRWLARFWTRCMGRAAVHLALLHGHHFLCLLLYLDRVQSERGCRQHAEVGRIHSRHPAGASGLRDYINDVLTRITLVGAPT
jgi:preprotein translocase subunit SecY